jgi:DNA-binding response OmpR family regulator
MLNASPKALVHATVSAELCGARIALINFPEEEAGEIAGALHQAKCVSRIIDMPSPRPGAVEAYGLDRYDFLLLNTTSGGTGMIEDEAMTLSRPWLLMGPPALVLQQATLHGRADDVLFTPYLMDELLFRISRTLRRRCLAVPPPVSRHRGSVLIADDDPAIHRLLESVLKSHNLDCYDAKDGRAALAVARELLPDLIVLDVKMQLLDGFGVLRLLRADRCTRNIKVILLTASTDMEDIQIGCSLGANDYIAKPFHHLTLVRKIRNLIAGPADAPPQFGAAID